VLGDLRRYFDQYSSVRFENYPVRGVPGEPMEVGR
jgi:hypothetical protein